MSMGQGADTIPRSFRPTGIRIGADLVAPIISFSDRRFSGHEFSADVDFYRYYLTADVGKWERDIMGRDGKYQHSGMYWRAGVDVNFLTKDPDRNMLFFGFRYGSSRFEEALTRTITDPVWGTRTDFFYAPDRKAGWLEITGGLRVKMYRFIWMGYTIRYKFGLNTRGGNSIAVYEVPGYGSTFKPATWGFNYLILIRMPFSREPHTR
jgi:hypothetical protein